MEKKRIRGWRMVRRAGTAVFSLVIFVVLSYSILIQWKPDLAVRIFPFQLYTVVTDSMVPTIPVNSLVLARRVRSDADLQPGSIITFQANRFGEDIILTHYLDSVELYEGSPRYRTHAEGTSDKDVYVTRREDILGIYVFHVPALGKLPLFLRSAYGISAMAVVMVILLISGLLQRKVERDGVETMKGFYFRFLTTRAGESCGFRALLTNRSPDAVLCLRARLCLYDRHRKLLYEEEMDLTDGRPLKPNMTRMILWWSEDSYPAAEFQLDILESTVAYEAYQITAKGVKRKGSAPRREAERPPARAPFSSKPSEERLHL